MKKLSPRQSEALALVAEGRFFPDLVKEEDGWHARWRVPGVENDWVDEYVRSANVTRLSEDAEDQKHETLHDAWLMALKSLTGLVRWDDAECAAFAAELSEWHGGAEEDAAARAAIIFTFAPEAKRFVVRCGVPKGRRGLRALGQSAFVFGPLRGLLSRDGHLEVELSRAEAESFLRGGARDLAEAGYSVLGVDLAASVSASVDLGASADSRAQAPQQPIPAKLVIKVDGQAVSADEIRFLLEQKSTLVFFRDRWIDVDRNILKEALRALEKNEGKDLKTNEAISFAMGIGAFGRMEIEEVRAHGWLRGLVHELKSNPAANGGILAPVASDGVPGLTAELRPYQARGAAWMKFLTDHGFGALLADDMGLGKTIQTIAWILLSRSPSTSNALRPFLIVAPLTLLSNWRHEFAKFAPGLKVYVHQGENRQLSRGFKLMTKDCDVVITSYSLLVRDYSILRETDWEGLVLDEAQAIKNPDTQVARATRSLGARKRVALTGTPIENSVSDVWSLEEYLNPTFLGDRKSFADRFVKPIAVDERTRAAKRLRRALEPFVLRRLKSDPEIAGELGEKREVKEYCTLSPIQRNEYEAVLEEYRTSEKRQGDVFALLTRLKLVCDGAGKLERLCELLESVFEAGESALVFSQYAKVGERIRKALAKRFGRTFPFLHGGLTARQREAEIAAFKDGGNSVPTCFILSLKAGGFGLNLTEATHVIHFDRWWNPAVEAQATDRAHRLGQTKTVFVHSFITEGTLEEHIDEILERKARVAGSLVQSGESFLSELSADEFNQVITLDSQVGESSPTLKSNNQTNQINQTI
ncbi:MAG: SNF2-related protein [Kiritimatiellia bacterium]|nr:SNF2-related protein [Kiritimatiellia bacterium]